MLKSTIFREYDIRGIADIELLDPDIELLGPGLGTYLLRHGGERSPLGRDTRLSSTRLRDALLARAEGQRLRRDRSRRGPYAAAVLFGLSPWRDGAVMITGSHNPPEYNGFKTVCGETTIHGEAIQEIRRMIESRRPRAAATAR